MRSINADQEVTKTHWVIYCASPVSTTKLSEQQYFSWKLSECLSETRLPPACDGASVLLGHPESEQVTYCCSISLFNHFTECLYSNYGTLNYWILAFVFFFSLSKHLWNSDLYKECMFQSLQSMWRCGKCGIRAVCTVLGLCRSPVFTPLQTCGHCPPICWIDPQLVLGLTFMLRKDAFLGKFILAWQNCHWGALESITEVGNSSLSLLWCCSHGLGLGLHAVWWLSLGLWQSREKSFRAKPVSFVYGSHGLEELASLPRVSS